MNGGLLFALFFAVVVAVGLAPQAFGRRKRTGTPGGVPEILNRVRETAERFREEDERAGLIPRPTDRIALTDPTQEPLIPPTGAQEKDAA